MKALFAGTFGLVLFVGMIVLAVAQLMVGFAGIQVHLGTGWAYAALVAALLFAFTLPMAVGAFFGAMNVWHWHWFVALIFAAPALLFMVPGLVSAAVDGVRNRS